MLLLCLINHVPFLPCTTRLNLIQGQHFQSMFWILYPTTLPARIAKMIGCFSYLLLGQDFLAFKGHITPLLARFSYGENCVYTAEGHHHLANLGLILCFFFISWWHTFVFDYSLIYLALLNYLIMYNGLIFLSRVMKCIFFTGESLKIPQTNFESENQPHNDDVNIEVDFFFSFYTEILVLKSYEVIY